MPFRMLLKYSFSDRAMTYNKLCNFYFRLNMHYFFTTRQIYFETFIVWNFYKDYALILTQKMQISDTKNMRQQLLQPWLDKFWKKISIIINPSIHHFYFDDQKGPLWASVDFFYNPSILRFSSCFLRGKRNKC